MKKYLRIYSTEIVFALISVLFILLTSAEILKPINITAIFLQNAHIFILVVGSAIIMTSKENIDISVGSFACFICSMAGVLMSVFKLSTALTVLILFVLGLLWGFIAGYNIAYFKIPAWVMTLAGYLGFRGMGVALINYFSDTGSIVGINQSFLRLFSGKIFRSGIGTFGYGSLLFCIFVAVIIMAYRLISFKKENVTLKAAQIISLIMTFVMLIYIGISFSLSGGVPVSFVWVFLVVNTAAIWLSKSSEGRKLTMLGANEENARIAGINTKRAIVMTYVFMAICATLTGCIVLGRFHASSSYAGINFEMDTIAACALGGISLYGGNQKIFKAVLGAALIGIINLGLSLIGVDMNWQWIVKGIIIIFAIGIDLYLKKERTE